MVNHDLSIYCSGKQPTPVHVNEGDTVTFINRTDDRIEVRFKPKSIFKEDEKSIELEHEGQQTLKVSKEKKKATYKWDCPETPAVVTRTGTINPSQCGTQVY